MALIKSTTLPYDGDAVSAYWKIIETNINCVAKSSHVTIACWINKQARLDGKQPFTSQSFDWSGDDFPFSMELLDEEGNNAVKISYEKIKESKLDENGVETNPLFGAEDEI